MLKAKDKFLERDNNYPEKLKIILFTTHLLWGKEKAEGLTKSNGGTRMRGAFENTYHTGSG